MAQTKKGKALERLRKVLDELDEMAEVKQLRLDSPPFIRWQRDAELAITNTFGGESNHIKDFERQILSYVNGASVPEVCELAKAILKSMIGEINEYWEDESEASRFSESPESEQINTKEVFIVHGRDEGTKNTVARFLESLDLKPVILAEQPSQGRTIIEKFERHARVEFAIVLLTPDDAGSLQGNENNLNPRARQNVIFELGFFIGRLGRERVRALTKGEVEIPSDYSGIEYIPLDDSEGWKLKLGQELKSAGYDIDANRIFAT